MAEPDTGTPAERLRAALDLAATAERMLRARLRREEPHLSDDELEGRIDAWYAHRPGAELGDAVGKPGTWPRR